MIYLDYSANTPADPAVLDAFLDTERRFPGNPNSNHPAGLAAREALAAATESIAELLHILPSEMIYTSGASEANNLAIKGIARAQRHFGKHIISTPLEHPSVSGPLTYLREQGWEIDLAEIGRDGKIDLENLKELLRPDTVLVAVTAVDSELGTVQPISELTQIMKDYPNCRLHVDATQAIGKIPFSFDGIDTVSFAAHKFYGLNGSGMLYKRNDLVIEPLIHGGVRRVDLSQRDADALTDPGAGDGAAHGAPGRPGAVCIRQGTERAASGGSGTVPGGVHQQPRRCRSPHPQPQRAGREGHALPAGHG